MYCRNCGKEVEDNMKFCPYCGTDRVSEQNAENIVKPDITIEEKIANGTKTGSSVESEETESVKIENYPEKLVFQKGKDIVNNYKNTPEENINESKKVMEENRKNNDIDITEKSIRDKVQNIVKDFPPLVLVVLLAILYILEAYFIPPIAKVIIETLVKEGLSDGILTIGLCSAFILCLLAVRGGVSRVIVDQDIPYRYFKGKAVNISRLFEGISKILVALGYISVIILVILNLMEYGWGWIILDGVESVIVWFVYAHICNFFVLLFADKEKLMQYQEEFKEEDEEEL